MPSTPSRTVAATSRGTFEFTPSSLQPADAGFHPGVQGHARPDVLSVNPPSNTSIPREPALAVLRPAKPSLVPERGCGPGPAYDVSSSQAGISQATPTNDNTTVLQDARATIHAH